MNGSKSASQRKNEQLIVNLDAANAEIERLNEFNQSIADQYNDKLKEMTAKLNRSQALVNFRSTMYQLLTKKSRFVWSFSRTKRFIENAEKHVLAAYDANSE